MERNGMDGKWTGMEWAGLTGMEWNFMDYGSSLSG